MDHDRVDHFSRYVSADFQILRPEAEDAELVLLRGRTKRKEEPVGSFTVDEGPEIPWMKNMPKTEE